MRPDIIKKIMAAVIATASLPLFAGETQPVILDDKNPAAYVYEPCDLFNKNVLYSNEDGAFIQSIKLLGRYNGQYLDINPDNVAAHGDRAYWQHRRARLGLSVGFLDDFEFKGELNVADGGNGNSALAQGRFFNDVHEMYIKWKPQSDFYVTLGKQKQKINREKTESSKRIPTVERAAISNEVSVNEYAWGGAVGFKTGALSHEFGLYNNGVDDDWEFPDFRGKILATYRAGYEINDNTGLFFDYMYTDTSANTAQARARSDYEHVFALGTESEWDRASLVTDLIYGANSSRFNGTDTWGLVILPTYEITEKLEAVARYSYMDSGRLQHPQRHTGFRNVDQLHTFYLGTNYKICGDQLKLMTGVEFASGTDHDGVTDYDSTTWMFAIRSYF